MRNIAFFQRHHNVGLWQLKMTLFLLLLGLLLLLLPEAAHAKPQLEDDGGYSKIVVAISPDLKESECNRYIDGIKILMTNTSTMLQDVTQNSAVYFRDVVIVLPTGWPCPNNYASLPQADESWAMATIRLGKSHPIFKDNPWTRQPRGCGREGDFIYISENFLLNDIKQYGSKEQEMVHEWAKYRWGVFEEYGHIFDPVYPPALAVNRSWEPNYCSDVPLVAKPHSWNGDDCQDVSTCTFDINESDNIDVMSSLMAVSFLPSVEKFCTNDVHNKDLPSKQNALCNGQSTWEVIKEHQDLKRSSLDGKEGDKSPSFRFVQANVPAEKYAIILQGNKKMGEVINRWEYLRDTTKQMARLLLPDNANVILISFDETVKVLGQVTLNDISEREKLADMVPKVPTTLLGRSAVEAIEKAAELLGSDIGTIILVVDCLTDYGVQTDNIVQAADVHRVWPILYPRGDSVSTKPYDDAATQTKGQSCSVPLETFSVGSASAQKTNNFWALSKCFQNILSDIIGQVGTGNCSSPDSTCTVNVDVNNNWGGKGWISTYWNVLDLSGGTQAQTEEVTGPGFEMKTLDTSYDTYHWAETKSLLAGKWSVKIVRQTAVDKVYVDIIGEIPKIVTSKAYLEVWASQDLNNLEYDSENAPVLFASVVNASSQILKARVWATINGKTQRLRDNGLAADVTGNDGIYSAFIMEPEGNIEITITADDNEGLAEVVLSDSQAVSNPTILDPVCCGSVLNISNTGSAAAFSLTKTFSANIVNSAPASLPPSPVRDLMAEPTGNNVSLTFTASGNYLDQGTASKIRMEYWELGNRSTTLQVRQFNNSVEFGSLVTIVFEPLCNLDLVFTVAPIGVSDREALPSNRAHARIPCGSPPISPPNRDGLDSGAIAGIVIGTLLGILIIALIVYLVLNWDHLDELLVWQWLTCKPCREKDIRNRIYKKQDDVIRRKVPPSNPVENVADLYAKPDLDAKHRAHGEVNDYDDDGGFARSSHHNTNNLDEPSHYSDKSSQSSSIPHGAPANLPINTIGLPENYDNYGYSGGSSTNSLAQQGYEGGYNYGPSGNELAYNPSTVAYVYDPRGNQDYGSANPVSSNSYYTQPGPYIQPALPQRKPHLKTEV